jgi:hypothetical protein
MTTKMTETLDLNLDNYSVSELFQLFRLPNEPLTESGLKNAKQIVLKMHPDKSRLDSKYFLFFSKAYKRIYSIYEFQNKNRQKTPETYANDFQLDDSKRNALDRATKMSPDKFNSWFNNAFEKNRVENPIERGHGDWLKSNDDYISVNQTVNKGNMNEIFEQKKKQMQSVIMYTGVKEACASSLGGSLLDDPDNYTDTQSHYTDLKQAYTETLIPVTLEDYNNAPKFRDISEYKAHRDNQSIAPMTEQESMKFFLEQERSDEQKSVALAFKYAKEFEQNKKKQEGFWSELRQITGW